MSINPKQIAVSKKMGGLRRSACLIEAELARVSSEMNASDLAEIGETVLGLFSRGRWEFGV
jgi:hypothetical protein